MLNKNTIPLGVLLGLALPVLSGLLFELVFKDVSIMGKRGAPYLIVIALNLLLLRYFGKKRAEKTVQGIIMVTFVFMLLVFLYRFKP